jgi:hypothetical protein
LTPVWQAAIDLPPVIWWGHLERIMLAVDDLGCRGSAALRDGSRLLPAFCGYLSQLFAVVDLDLERVVGFC